MTKKLFVAWQDPEKRIWYPVGILSEDAGMYSFGYTEGALVARNDSDFNGFQSFPDLFKIYESDRLFPIFKNRLLSTTRPEYNHFIQWLNLEQNNRDPIAILARSGGKRETDTIEVFEAPMLDCQNLYKTHFFVHGIRHIKNAELIVQESKAGDHLVLVPEPENKFDRFALRIDKIHGTIGYCPRYVNKDFGRLLALAPSECLVTIARINPEPVPIQFRLLCTFTAPWPEGFRPFDEATYTPLGKSDKSLASVREMDQVGSQSIKESNQLLY